MFVLAKLHHLLYFYTDSEQSSVNVLTSMSDSDWHGPLKSRSTEGQALSCGRSTAQLLANSAGSSVRMPETQSKRTQSLCQRCALWGGDAALICATVPLRNCSIKEHQRDGIHEMINENILTGTLNVKADINNLFSELIFSVMQSFVL